MIFPKEFFDRAAYNDEKIPQISMVIKLCRELSQHARDNGLLSLEEMIPDIMHPLLKKGIRLVCDGCDPEILEELLWNDLCRSTDSGSALMIKMIELCGVLSIQSALSPDQLSLRLYSLAGIPVPDSGE